MFAKKIGIDLGSTSTRVYVRGEGIVVDEPSLAAVETAGTRVIAIGREARELAERSPHAVRLVRPAQGGPPLTEPVLRHLVTRAQGRQRLFRPEVMLCVPAAATSRHRRMMAEAAIGAGARQAWLIEAPLAIAMGLGLPVAEPRGHAVCDLGAAGAQVAVISLSGVLATRTVAAGGDHLDAAIALRVRERYGVILEERDAESLKVALGSALLAERQRSLTATGRDTVSDSTATATVSSADITDAVQEPLRAVAAAVREVLAQTPRRLVDGVRERGLFLAGGGALLRGVDVFLATATGMPVRVAAEPLTCAVRGTRRALGEFELLQRRQLYLR